MMCNESFILLYTTKLVNANKQSSMSFVPAQTLSWQSWRSYTVH